MGINKLVEKLIVATVSMVLETVVIYSIRGMAKDIGELIAFMSVATVVLVNVFYDELSGGK